eukprot:SAG11_NODE_17292_length_522_cov_1.650118_1_plen_114_part_10
MPTVDQEAGVNSNNFDGATFINTGKYVDTDGATIQGFNDLTNTPTYQIRLVDMFPWLGQIQLPLYLMKEQVSIEMYFETDAKSRYCIPSSGTDPGAVTIDPDQTKLVADYIYYP